jgi:hypothetical protein
MIYLKFEVLCWTRNRIGILNVQCRIHKTVNFLVRIPVPVPVPVLSKKETFWIRLKLWIWIWIRNASLLRIIIRNKNRNTNRDVQRAERSIWYWYHFEAFSTGALLTVPYLNGETGIFEFKIIKISRSTGVGVVVHDFKSKIVEFDKYKYRYP